MQTNANIIANCLNRTVCKECSKIAKTFLKSSQRFYLAQTLTKSITTSKQRLDELFITKQNQKARNKNKIGLPPNKRYRLTPLGRHDDFNDARIKDNN